MATTAARLIAPSGTSGATGERYTISRITTTATSVTWIVRRWLIRAATT